MKRALKFLCLLTVLTVVFLLPAAASPEGNQSNYEYWQQQWDEHGYPDDIGGQYSKDGSIWVQVVETTPERMEELRGMFGDKISLTKYSFNELEGVRQEIEAVMQAPESKIYGLGTGWSSNGNGVFGFGESGTEFRVVVIVDKSMYEHYSAEFARQYGDKVYVEAGGQANLLDARETATSDTQTVPSVIFWPVLIGAGAALLGAVAIALWRAMRKR